MKSGTLLVEMEILKLMHLINKYRRVLPPSQLGKLIYYAQEIILEDGNSV